MSEVHSTAWGELIDELETAFAAVTSPADLQQATVDLVDAVLEVDMCVLASEDAGSLAPVASVPPGWTDTDDVLAPVSLPVLAMSRDESCRIADRADVRAATAAAPATDTASYTYRSLMATPVGNAQLLVVGSHEPGAFTEADLERLRVMSAAATVLQTRLESAPNPTATPDRFEKAAAVLDHDAKNFLTILRGQLEFARSDGDPARFEAIKRATQRLEALIDDTVTLLHTGEQISERDPVAVPEVAAVAWDAVDTETADILLSPVGTVEADRTRLCQLFENLFRNAVDHGGLDVSVWVGRLAAGNGFFVADDGPGFEVDETGDPFEFGLSSVHGHSGLGLNIVQWIAKAHGWQVSVTTSEFGGACVEIRGVEFLDTEPA